MIYLTFDSNIWIYLLDNAWTISNPLDYLEHWLAEKHVEILVPEIISTEWNKHKDIEKGYRIKKLKEFFNMAQELMPSSFIDEYNKPDNLTRIVEEQFLRIEKLIHTDSKLLPIENGTRLKAVQWAVDKKAPMHKKSSMADTLIVWAIIDYAANNPGHEYFFISNNIEDFYEGTPKKIHIHLKEHFEITNIKEYRNLEHVIHELKGKLPITVDMESFKKERIKAKLQLQIYNPDIEKVVSTAEDSYLSNISLLDQVIVNPNPTPAQMAFAIGLTESDPSYAYHFYKNLKNPLWLDHLINRGTYHPSNNPLTEKTDKGYNTPLWSPLLYLLTLASDRVYISVPSHAKKIIEIADNISKNPKENSRSWHLIIEIVDKIPTENIPLAFLEHIQVWLSSKIDTYIIGVKLCEDILPKFYNANPTPEDVLKGQFVFKEIFRLYQSEETVPNNKIPGELYSPIFDYYLSKLSHQKVLIQRIVHNDKYYLINFISSQLTLLLLDYPKGITTTIKAGSKSYDLIAFVVQEDAQVTIVDHETQHTVCKSLINDFLFLTESEFETAILSFLSENNINYNESENKSHTLAIITINLLRGKSYQLDLTPMHKLKTEEDEMDLIPIYSKMLLALLLEYVIQFPLDANRFLWQFWTENPLPVHRRIVLYTIAQTWNTTHSLFTTLLRNHPSIFYLHDYEIEFYLLLKETATHLSEIEISTIKPLIEKGPPELAGEGNSEAKEYWQLKWYAALKDTPDFQDTYQTLSNKFKRTQEDIDSEGEIRVRVGTVSPFTTEEILGKSNKEIVQFILQFKPKDSWGEPNIDGLAERLGKALEDQPQRFVEELPLYLPIPFIYIYYILNGLAEAWKKQQSFDWEKVIDFCKQYIEQPAFSSGELKQAGDSWKADSEWITGYIGRLLSSGMQHDDHAFDPALLPKVKTLLLRLCKDLEIPKQAQRDNMDYPTYSLNSTAGKVLRALFDYSLRWARIYKLHDEDKWDTDIKAAFEATMQKGIIDGFILQGMYFHQFYWLDKIWLTELVKRLETIEEKYWLAFMGGYSFATAPNSKEVYDLMYPHYEKVIGQQLEFSNFNERTIVLHLVSYLFWGYESIYEKRLVYLYLTKMPAKAVDDFILFITRNEKYYHSLKEEDKSSFEATILLLWDLVNCRFSTPQNDSEKKTIATLASLLPFMPRLDEHITTLVLDSVKYMSEYYHWHTLIEDLTAISKVATDEELPANIGKILLSSPELPLHTNFESEKLIMLVEYLYENGQKATANKISDAVSKQGNDFLRDLYKKYN
jgi:hypothetical protein